MGTKFGRCPTCRANLDPGEECDCHMPEERVKMPKKLLFERGKTYRFSKKKFKELMRIPEEDIEQNWMSWIDGAIVTTENPYRANYGTITIFPEWCEEVTDGQEHSRTDRGDFANIETISQHTQERSGQGIQETT